MFEKIFRKLGYVDEKVVKSWENEYRAIVDEKRKLSDDLLERRAKDLTRKETVADQYKYIDPSLGDPTPTDSDERKQYVASTALFFNSILEKKLLHMISVAHTLGEHPGNDRDFDLILKGAIYSWRELLLWGRAMMNEQLSYQVEGKKTKETLEDYDTK